MSKFMAARTRYIKVERAHRAERLYGMFNLGIGLNQVGQRFVQPKAKAKAKAAPAAKAVAGKMTIAGAKKKAIEMKRNSKGLTRHCFDFYDACDIKFKEEVIAVGSGLINLI